MQLEHQEDFANFFLFPPKNIILEQGLDGLFLTFPSEVFWQGTC